MSEIRSGGPRVECRKSSCRPPRPAETICGAGLQPQWIAAGWKNLAPDAVALGRLPLRVIASASMRQTVRRSRTRGSAVMFFFFCTQTLVRRWMLVPACWPGRGSAALRAQNAPPPSARAIVAPASRVGPGPFSGAPVPSCRGRAHAVDLAPQPVQPHALGRSEANGGRLRGAVGPACWFFDAQLLLEVPVLQATASPTTPA